LTGIDLARELSPMALHDDLEDVDPRIRQARTVQLRRARAAIWLACEEAGPHMAVIQLNDALREQLDRLGDEGG
jgi:hypothetical protein